MQSLAWQRAAHRVMAEQGKRVAIPRRFGYTIEDIWALQPRFAERTRKRVFRLMAHPRFRAAYDFLLLRAGESDELRESGEWWTEIQALSADQVSEQLAAKTTIAGAGEKPAGSGRRRRRGGRGRKAAAPKSDSPE